MNVAKKVVLHVQIMLLALMKSEVSSAFVMMVSQAMDSAVLVGIRL